MDDGKGVWGVLVCVILKFTMNICEKRKKENRRLTPKLDPIVIIHYLLLHEINLKPSQPKRPLLHFDPPESPLMNFVSCSTIPDEALEPFERYEISRKEGRKECICPPLLPEVDRKELLGEDLES